MEIETSKGKKIRDNMLRSDDSFSNDKKILILYWWWIYKVSNKNLLSI